MVFSIPQASMIPPKTIAQMMSQTVLSMPAIPRVFISSSTDGSPVVTATDPNIVFIMAIYACFTNDPPVAATSSRM